MGRREVIVAVDTNILLRAAVRDDPRQAQSAAHLLRSADRIAIPLVALCEFAWVMRNGYKRPAAEVATSIRSLVNSAKVIKTNVKASNGVIHVINAVLLLPGA